MGELIPFVPKGPHYEWRRQEAELDLISREIVTRASEIKEESEQAISEAESILGEESVFNQNSANFEERDQVES